MIIAVENELDSVKRELISQGFTVVPYPESNQYDALVYLENAENASSYPGAAYASVSSKKAIMVNARGRTPKEICAILRRNLHSNFY